MSSSSILEGNQASNFTALVIATINKATGLTYGSDGVCFVALGFFASTRWKYIYIYFIKRMDVTCIFTLSAQIFRAADITITSVTVVSNAADPRGGSPQKKKGSGGGGLCF